MCKTSFLPILTVFFFIYISDNKFIIQSPPQLKSQLQKMYPDGIHYSVANYGDVPYGKSLSGTVYIGKYLQNCQYQSLGQQAQRNINKVVLSTRGDCTFTTKSLNSQKEGAKMAIIADNNQYQQPGSIIMVDDGKGAQVRIPTVLITHQVGAYITDYITNKNKNVTVLVSFQTYKKQKADVTLWMSAYDRKSYILIRQLQPYLNRIKQSINLSVYHPTTACSTCLATDCYDNNNYCINTGFYGYMIQNYGRELIKLQLKQQQIMKMYPSLWWKYIQQYDQQCDERNQLFQCSNNIMNKLGINSSLINNNIDSNFYNTSYIDQTSGENKTKITNNILQNNNQLRYKSGLLVFPGIIINNITYRGNLDGLQIFQMICQSLTIQPQGCNLQVEPKKQSILKYVIIVSIVLIIFMIFLVLCYRRHVRRQLSRNLNNQVNQLVNQYITMYEAQRFDHGDNIQDNSKINK